MQLQFYPCLKDLAAYIEYALGDKFKLLFVFISLVQFHSAKRKKERTANCESPLIATITKKNGG